MSALPPPLPRFPSSPPPPVQSFGIGYHKGKVLWTVVGSFILAAVVLGCGGLIHLRWVGWCLIVLSVLIAIFAISSISKLFDGGAVLFFAPEGLHDNSRKPRAMIPWNDIRKVTLFSVRVNGMPAGRTLILELSNKPEDEATRRISLSDLKGNPSQTADLVVAWTNRCRTAPPILLENAMGDEA
jgi:hypothetical protein